MYHGRHTISMCEKAPYPYKEPQLVQNHKNPLKNT